MAEAVKTEQWHFQSVVHLRLRDQSLLKFAPGVRNVPSDIGDAEREILKRHGATPVTEQPKQASNEAESASSEAQGAEGSQGKEDTGEGSKKESTTATKVSKNK
jgi:hypothetical protein